MDYKIYSLKNRDCDSKADKAIDFHQIIAVTSISAGLE